MHLEARSHFSNSNIPGLVGFPVITTCQSESAVFPAASVAKRDRITSFFWCRNRSEYRNREKKVEGRGGADEVTTKIRPPHPWGKGAGVLVGFINTVDEHSHTQIFLILSL